MMFAFAVLRLGLSPADFWTLSAAEWRALLDAAAPQAMTRDALSALMKTHGGGDA
ncbi:phage tail assembly chaperone [Hyphococcus luteus]|uniref:Phage tail assembly chaperone n=1 Tax=Hyphococcus luteus TaxID=2058213 RepID=A0A2S7K406_9PROT|nr:phage tail assembly chaperone [Marinicaulis flavus]PQA87244.1 phage tail assembly chaperone [Marinicaulis flavus]